MKPSLATLAVPAVWLLCSVSDGAAPDAPALSPGDIVAHLARTISWYRRLWAVEQSAPAPGDSLLRDNAQRGSVRALQLAFDFARAMAPLAAPAQPAARETSSSFNVEQSSARAAERVAALETRIAEADAALAKAAPRSRDTIAARRRELAAELNLAKQIRDSVQGLRVFLTGQTTGGGADLRSYIDRLERTVPEAMRGAQQPSALAPAPAGAEIRPESAGILGLVAETIRMAQSRRRLAEALDETDALRKSTDQLRTPLVAEVRAIVRRSDEVAGDSASQDARQMDKDRLEVEALAARFKQLSAALAPLREQGLQIEAARGGLVEWRNRVEQRYSAAAGYLVFRVLALAAAVVLVIGISELWRRAAFRYVRDVRRRKQFLLLRRVVAGVAVGAVVLLALVNEFGSLATYAGFLTAGLAVAIQNVILSVVAYFFLIGRYGLRIGDRVTISGVTGDVLDIGLVRIHLIEMTGAGSDLHPTGRVVAFSNSVVFQPAALFRQMPGTDYTWHTVALTLVPGADPRLAESRLMAAAASVYEEYRERIEQQHAAFQRMVDLPVPPPKPGHKLKITDAGVEFTVRYPVETRQASVTDGRMVNALHDAVASEPRLALAGAGAPKLQEAP